MGGGSIWGKPWVKSPAIIDIFGVAQDEHDASNKTTQVGMSPSPSPFLADVLISNGCRSQGRGVWGGEGGGDVCFFGRDESLSWLFFTGCLDRHTVHRAVAVLLVVDLLVC